MLNKTPFWSIFIRIISHEHAAVEAQQGDASQKMLTQTIPIIRPLVSDHVLVFRSQYFPGLVYSGLNSITGVNKYARSQCDFILLQASTIMCLDRASMPVSVFKG